MAKAKVDVYQEVTDRIVAALEAGTVPWRKPWNGGSGPRNQDGKFYRGINIMLLSMSGYDSPFWMTFKQVQARGGSVVKGEKSTLIVFWSMFKGEDRLTGKDKMIPMLRYYRVFNVAQTINVKPTKAMTEWANRPASENVVNTDAQTIVDNYPNPPQINTNGSEAYYVPALDSITVPPLSAYAVRDEFYSTLFHEMGHSTSHESRLNRPTGTTFGSHDYGKEELVAEMTATFLASEAGITVTDENSAAYLASWLRTIKGDVKMVVSAAGQAQKAADHILGRVWESEKADDEKADTEAPADAVDGLLNDLDRELATV